MSNETSAPVVRLTSNAFQLDRAFTVAMGDLLGNVAPYQSGLLTEAAPCLMAGLSYPDPWTRDAAINTWNGGALILPQVMKNTLLATLTRDAHGLRIGGQYWDAMIWAIGAWHYYLNTGDMAFLETAREATVNALRFFEGTEFDEQTGLFRGAACFQDGIAGYTDRYAGHSSSGIHDWPAAHPNERAQRGEGLPMQVLSTNCLYERAYRLLEQMDAALGDTTDGRWERAADRMREAINDRLWSDHLGQYWYYDDPWGGCDHQEALGHAFALLFGVADDERAGQVLNAQRIEPAGVPCVYPAFDRYRGRPNSSPPMPGNEEPIWFEELALRDRDPSYASCGVHSGMVWPHVQGIWGEAALVRGRPDLFEHELWRLAGHIARDVQCPEKYHPTLGLPYGGLQEAGEDDAMHRWASCYRQTWTATALIRLVLRGICGLRFEPAGLRFEPHMPTGLEELRLTGLNYRGAMLNVQCTGEGSIVSECWINGRRSPASLRAVPSDVVEVALHMKRA